MGEVEEIYELILDDLEFAESHLPISTWNTPDLSVEVVDAMPELWKDNTLLVHRGWVKSFRANVYLTMAGWPLGRTELYAMAAKDAAEVVENTGGWGYRLLEDYQELWLKENNFNAEGIIWFAHAPDAVFLHLAPNSGRPIDEPDGIMRGWNDYMVEIPFYESFPVGYRKEVTFTTGWYTGKVGNESSWVEWKDHGYRHPYIAKWRSTDGFPHDSTWTSEFKPDIHHRAMHTLRYAHVLLIYAEASARASGGVPDALAVDA
jgi:hypothetical protein